MADDPFGQDVVDSLATAHVAAAEGRVMLIDVALDCRCKGGVTVADGCGEAGKRQHQWPPLVKSHFLSNMGRMRTFTFLKKDISRPEARLRVLNLSAVERGPNT